MNIEARLRVLCELICGAEDEETRLKRKALADAIEWRENHWPEFQTRYHALLGEASS